ncbi:MAG: DMT family transporter [Paracoccaceae bacterium]
MLAVVLSLAAAFTFSLGSMMVSALSGRVGVFQLGRWQMAMAFAMSASVSVALGGWARVEPWQFGLLAASSATGIMIASASYFATIYVAGPRLSALLFSLAAPFAALEGYLFLGEVLGPGQVAGIALILSGIALAVLWGAGSHPDDAPRHPLWQGLALGALTAAGQATGTLLARPAMEAGVEPFTAMAIRSGLGGVFFVLLMVFPFARAARRPGWAELRIISGSAFVGMFLGMTLMMAALASGEVGIVSTLTSTTPILILPMIWLTSGTAPRPAAWAGAALAVLGTALISLAA